MKFANEIHKKCEKYARLFENHKYYRLRVTGYGHGRRRRKTHVIPCVCKAKVAKITLCACVSMKRIGGFA